MVRSTFLVTPVLSCTSTETVCTLVPNRLKFSSAPNPLRSACGWVGKDACTSARSEQQGISPADSPSIRSWILVIVAPEVEENTHPDTTPIPLRVSVAMPVGPPEGFSSVSWIAGGEGQELVV